MSAMMASGARSRREMAFEGASSFSRSVRSSQPIPGWPMTWAISRPMKIFPIPPDEGGAVV